MSSSWTWIGTSCLCCAWPLVGSQQLCQFLAGLAWRSLSSDLTTLQTPVVSCPWNVTAKLSFINPWLLCAHRLPLWGQHSRWLVSTDQFTLESVHLTRRRVISWIPISRCACFARPYIHPASRGGAAHTAGFFGQLKHIYKKSGKNIVFFSVFTMCSVENTVIYAVFGIKSVQNSGFCSVFKALASKKVQCRDLPKPLKTPLFTLFSSIFPCANAAGQLKHIYKKSFKNIVFFSVFTFFPSKTP